ncbi:MAG: cob(I)yrinic acid a,c-diamide adenosyltransferase [Alphaproteobacteria bacterium]
MVKLNKIYTRTGDEGTTGLTGGERRNKYDLRVKAYGTVDEANAAIGMARIYSQGVHDDMLMRIQHDLFDLGADLSTPMVTGGDKALRIIQSQIDRLEQEIDSLNEHLAPLNSFVLPGGTELSANLHLARTVVRRAERVACELAVKEKVNLLAIKYLNRLSDFLFVLSRAANGNGAKDVLWKPGVNR